MLVDSINSATRPIVPVRSVNTKKTNAYKALVKLGDLYTQKECKEIVKAINKDLSSKIPENQDINAYYDPNQLEIFIYQGCGAGGVKVKNNGKAILVDGNANHTRPIELKGDYSVLFNETLNRYNQAKQTNNQLAFEMNNLAQMGKSQFVI
ncbi:TPA: hypothetical protein IAA87_01430 [Candidatus Avigastranaerophilus faecigallinarum]|nr:hypothetical protein [Candidatus Avigastranaerophilus faecigallinarum]